MLYCGCVFQFMILNLCTVDYNICNLIPQKTSYDLICRFKMHHFFTCGLGDKIAFPKNALMLRNIPKICHITFNTVKRAKCCNKR